MSHVSDPLLACFAVCSSCAPSLAVTPAASCCVAPNATHALFPSRDVTHLDASHTPHAQLPFGRTLTAAEEYVHGLDEATGEGGRQGGRVCERKRKNVCVCVWQEERDETAPCGGGGGHTHITHTLTHTLHARPHARPPSLAPSLPPSLPHSRPPSRPPSLPHSSVQAPASSSPCSTPAGACG